MHIDLFFATFVTFVVTSVIEIILAARWNRAYFRSGVLVFRQVCELPSDVQKLPEPEVLQARFTGWVMPAILFRSLSLDEIGFREKLMGFHLISYTPVMHGHIEVDPVGRVVNVSGRLNWSMMAFGLSPLALLGTSFAAMFGLFFLGLVVVIYLTQAARYRNVSTALSTIWSGGV